MNRIWLITAILLAACVPPPSQSVEQRVGCASSGIPSPFAAPNNLTELMNSALAFLNSGGHIEELRNLMGGLQNATVDLQKVYLKGDDAPAIVMAINFRGDLSQQPPDSGVVILYCNRETYIGEIRNASPIYLSIHVSEIVDLKQDGRQEAVIATATGGQGGCNLGISIIGWEEDQLIDYFGGGGPNADCMADLRVLNKPSGETELIVQGSTFTSTGGGPGRDVVYHYQLNDKQFVLISTEYTSAPDRIHVLQDAQIALDAGDTAKATELYQKAVTDSTLVDADDWILNDGTPNRYQAAYLKAFAYFRLIAIKFWQGREADAQAFSQEFEANYPPSTHGSEMVEAIRLFEAGLAEGKSVIQACGAVTDFIETNYPVVEEYFYSGYNNLIITNEAVCPFK